MQGTSDVIQKVLLAAACDIVGATGVASTSRNCAVARTGAGVYTVTLPSGYGLDVDETIINVTVEGVGIPAAIVTSDTVVTVSTFDAAGVAADVNIQSIEISRLL